MQTQTQAQIPNQIKVNTPLGEITVELVKIEKRYNINAEDILKQVKAYLFSYDDKSRIVLYKHDTWGSCREWKSILLNADGSYISDGEWVDQSSRKNAHKYKIMDLNEFLEKYRGKELIMYVHESPSCNPSKEFSFRVVVKIT
ncbi:MAG: hypothetical protein LM583_06695 [Desulfurococcaceae archaeon]|nr:hypothetical protein [Desulfurococcaceae archaeon]